MKLELKHLAPYLPYQLKVQSVNHFETYEVEGLKQTSVQLLDMTYDTDYFDLKPILRPLSDLTKEIDGLGIPLFELLKMQYKEFTTAKMNENYAWKFKDLKNGFNVTDKNNIIYLSIDKDIRLCQKWILDKLFEWHFDVFGLIEQGLAIDKNTL